MVTSFSPLGAAQALMVGRIGPRFVHPWVKQTRTTSTPRSAVPRVEPRMSLAN